MSELEYRVRQLEKRLQDLIEFVEEDISGYEGGFQLWLDDRKRERKKQSS